MSGPIGDYALIGDCETAALVSKEGSVDWLCWPRFDSPASFAALLGTADNGRWSITATGKDIRTSRTYRKHTLVLETVIETATGAVTVVDFMPLRGEASHLVRLVYGVRGHVMMRTELRIRFDYGSIVPWVTTLEDGSLRAIAGPDMIILRTNVPLRGLGFMTIGEFRCIGG
jgi:GH15 family glucan-1,4-alpha-glucosidase